MSKINLFQTIDKSLFNFIDQLKTNSSFTQIQDQINALDSKQQKIVSFAISAFVIILPVIITATLLFFNIQERKTIEIKKAIINYAALIDKNARDLNQMSGTSIAAGTIDDRSQLDNKIRNILSQNQIDQSKVTIVDFNELTRSGSIVSTESKIEINRFANQDLNKFLRALLEREKFKISDISFAKNKESSLLSGSMTLIHIGKNLNTDEE